MPKRLIQKITGFLSQKRTSQTEATVRPPAPKADVVEKTNVIETLANGAVVIPEDIHQIRRKFLDDNATKVVYRLTDQGHEAYLVGGCIRDLLLKKRPKDFDVATSAHPEQAHELFKRSRLIGRRFKLLHVRFGREIIEVATFRADHDSAKKQSDNHGKQADSGLILRDNVYGSIEDDAIRRDFTINALYYCVNSHKIYDFTQGYEDLNAKKIRMIGDPESRYREDPVRMLRAIRFAAKLKFSIEPQTEAPIRELSGLLQGIAPARLFDEVLKLFQSGHAVGSFTLLREYDLFVQLLPGVEAALQQDDSGLVESLIVAGLKNTDRRINQRKSVTPAFLYATMLWHPLQTRMQALRDADSKMPVLAALHAAANDVLAEQVKRTAIPRRFSTPIREIWELQLRLPRRHGNRAQQTLDHPRFRAAYDLLLLREQSGESLDNLGEWWTEFQSANSERKEEMVNAIPTDKGARSPRKPRRRSRAKNDPRNKTS